MVFGGGVLLIDAVLVPYRPGWFIRWGWIVVVVFLVLCAAAAMSFLVWRLILHRRSEKEYSALADNEED